MLSFILAYGLIQGHSYTFGLGGRSREPMTVERFLACRVKEDTSGGDSAAASVTHTGGAGIL